MNHEEKLKRTLRFKFLFTSYMQTIRVGSFFRLKLDKLLFEAKRKDTLRLIVGKGE